MKRIFKESIIICILTVILIDVMIGWFLFKNRSFPRLAMWNIIESNKFDDFYWQPKDAPHYFYFESDSAKLAIFREEICPLVKDEEDELERVIKIARYVKDISNSQKTYKGYLKWDSPEGMLKQIKEGKRGVHCFHYSILFSTYLSGLDIKSRLWALEGNDGLGKLSHTVTEVYIEGLKKWVVIDASWGICFIKENYPLSVLELRDNLLGSDTDKILVYSISGQINNQKTLLDSYAQFLKCVFLRSGNDFVNKYDAKIRYGIFSRFQRYLDKLPSQIRRGLGYLFGRRDFLIHYVDRFDRSFKFKIIIAKFFFYFLVISLSCIIILFLIIRLKLCFTINLSRKDTCHR